MNKIQTFEQFLATQSTFIPVWGFIFNLVLAALLGSAVGMIYVRYGRSLTNRKLFAHNFVLITMTTAVIITIVKSSLALSLGLVGALSIVRFRAAIKEPEELAYLFLCIAIGLGLGADQRLITLIAFAAIVGVILIKNLLRKTEEGHNLCLTLSSTDAKHIQLDQIVDILKKFCLDVQLRRFDEVKDMLEASFYVAYKDFNYFKQSREELKKIHSSLKITFLDNKGIG